MAIYVCERFFQLIDALTGGHLHIRADEQFAAKLHGDAGEGKRKFSNGIDNTVRTLVDFALLVALVYIYVTR